MSTPPSQRDLQRPCIFSAAVEDLLTPPPPPSPPKCHGACGSPGLTCSAPRSLKGFRIAFLLNESKCYRANESAQSDCEAIRVWVNVTRPVLPQRRCACKPTSEEPLTEMSDWPTRSEASVQRKLSLYAAAEPAHVWVSVRWSAERLCCGFGRSEPATPGSGQELHIDIFSLVNCR